MSFALTRAGFIKKKTPPGEIIMTPEYNEITVVQLIDGRLQLFAIDTEYQLWSCWSESGWTSFTPFQMPPTGGVIQISGGLLSNCTQLWAIDTHQNLWTCWKTGDSNAAWNAWQPFNP